MKNLQDELSEKKINYWNLEAQKKKDYSLAQQKNLKSKIDDMIINFLKSKYYYLLF